MSISGFGRNFKASNSMSMLMIPSLGTPLPTVNTPLPRHTTHNFSVPRLQTWTNLCGRIGLPKD
jgi:hypothetical protein